MTEVLLGLEPTSNRRIYLADSFQGLPKDTDVSAWKSLSNTSGVLGGKIMSTLHGQEGQFATTRNKFEVNMASNGFNISVLKHRIRVLEGFYEDTLPQLKSENVKLSFLRLDGDIYISTIQALENAYELVQPGGYIYVDDYGSFEGCRRAVDFFKQSIGDNEPLFPIFEEDKATKFEAVWWRKPKFTIKFRHTFKLTQEQNVNFMKLIYVVVTLNMLFLFAFLYTKRIRRNSHGYKR